MTPIDALLLAIIEGITEFLPISSTGHLVLTSALLHIPQTDFVKSFEITIQSGAILAVIFLYWKQLIKNSVLLKKMFVAFIPTALIGLTLYKIIKDILLGNPFISLLSLFIGGIFMIGLELYHKDKDYTVETFEKLSYKKALGIGFFQSLSVIPGVSRAAATILGGMLLGANRRIATEFSFLLAIPTMIAATGLDLIKSDFSFTQQEYLLLCIGFFGSFLVAIFAIKYLLYFIRSHTFIPFGIYRIILALLFWVFVI